MGGVRGEEEGHTQEHTQDRTSECCSYPLALATYPLKSEDAMGGGGTKGQFRKRAVLVNMPLLRFLVPGNIRMCPRSGFWIGVPQMRV